MNTDQILNDAAAAVIAHSKTTAAPVAEIICRTNPDQTTHIYMLFADIKDYAAMEEQSLKDPMMGIFIRYLTSHEFPFGDSVQLKFHFGLQD